jgi:transcriptional regulator of arginine metabolism
MASLAASRPALAARSARRRTILELVDQLAVGSQEELAALLRARGFAVTQATVSRDISDLGLVKAIRADRHVYVTPRSLTMPEPAGTPAGGRATSLAPDPAGLLTRPGLARLRRILADYPVRIARSGLSLVLVSTSGTASSIAQAIDDSGMDDQVGTLAGDNTLLVLFADEPALERWRARFGAMVTQARAGVPGDDLAGTYP